MMDLLQTCDVILLDQGKTFMFDNDRFGPEADYFETYSSLGGCELDPDAVRTLVRRLYNHLLAVSRSPVRYNSFPTIPSALRELQPVPTVGREDIERIAELFAIHEIGRISSRHADVLRTLSQSHRLGIVSNILGPRKPFEDNLARAGVIDCFEACVWSSDYGAIKPSLELFRRAIARFGVEPSRILVVGDHPLRDVDAAKALGCSAVWVRNDRADFPAGLRQPDLVIRDLGDLPKFLSEGAIRTVKI